MRKFIEKFKIKNIIVGVIVLIGLVLIMLVIDKNISDFLEIFHNININSFSSTLLQIQSTIVTLTIALVALISGNIGKSYMGVSICDFFLNIRPMIFKQKRIVISSLILLAISVLFHLWSLYNWVLLSFFTTIILIILSVCEVYDVFKGNEFIESEIKQYLDDTISDEKSSYSRKKDLLLNFIDDWKESCLFQSQSEYEDYLEIFNLGMHSLLKNKSDQSIKDVEKLCFEEAYCLLCADKRQVVERGINFVENVYKQIDLFITNEKAEKTEYTVSFNLFGEILFTLEKAMEFLPLSTVEQSLDLGKLFFYISNVCYKLHCNDELKKEVCFPELQSVFEFCRYIGNYLGKQVRFGRTINTNHWAYIIKRSEFFPLRNVPQKINENYLKFKCLLYFNYCYGLICNGLFSIVKKAVFYSSMSNFHKIRNRYEVIYYLSITCFLYYLAEKENESCVSNEFKDNAKKIIEDDKVQNSFKYFLYVLSEQSTYLNIGIEKELYYILRPCEFFPKYSTCKTVIMDQVTEEFYVFLIMYIEYEYGPPNLFSFAFGKNYETLVKYQNDFLGACESRTKTNLTKFYSLFDGHSKPEKNLQKITDSMYENFKRYITLKYKELEIKKAAENQHKYESNKIQKKYIENCNVQIKSHILKDFAPIISPNEDSSQGTFLIPLLRIGTDTASIINNADPISIEWMFSYINSNFFQNMCELLIEKNFVTVKHKKDFDDISDLADYLNMQKVQILIGSEHRLKYEKSFQKYDCICMRYITDILALKKNSIKINIKRVITKIHPGTFELERENIYYDKNRDQYRYDISGRSAFFTKAELESFLHNYRKVIDISVEMSCDCHDAGILIKNDS
jgi:hypothetical protein